MKLRNRRDTINVNGEEYTILRVMRERRQFFCYVVSSQAMYLMKEFKDEEGYKKASDAYRKLRSFHIDSPKVIAENICMRIIIQDYLSGVLASEMIIRGEMDGAHLNQVREIAMAAESNGISLDYFPGNFMVTKRGIVYVGDIIYEKNDNNTFDEAGMKYWMNASGCLREK